VYLIFRDGRLTKAADYLTVLEHHLHQQSAAINLVECETCGFAPTSEKWDGLFQLWSEEDAFRKQHEENTVLPAFLLLAPIVVPAAVMALPFKLFSREDESPQWPDVRLGLHRQEVTDLLGEPSDSVHASRPLWLYRDPNHQHDEWPRSVLILRFRDDRVIEVLHDDFAAIALRTEVDVPRQGDEISR
jgi:hypothetical protein